VRFVDTGLSLGFVEEAVLGGPSFKDLGTCKSISPITPECLIYLFSRHAQLDLVHPKIRMMANNLPHLKRP
jgi:hypothetical protein